MAATASALRDRVAFEVNIPLQIELDGDGKPTPQLARDGSQEYRYFLRGHSIMWVPPAVHDAIQRAKADEGDTFTITRRKAPRAWEVIHHADEPTSAAVRRTETAPASRYRPPDELTPEQRQAANQDAACPPDWRAANATKPPLFAPQSDSYYTALCAAIRTAAAAEKFASEIGRPVAFDTGDIRAMATTLYIQQNGGRA